MDQRLNDFYGPLYVATVAGNIAYNSLLQKQGKKQCHPIRDEDLKEWALWMTTIFMPLNDVREKIIIENAHLIVKEQMPPCAGLCDPRGGLQGAAGASGPRATKRAPLHHRLAAGV